MAGTAIAGCGTPAPHTARQLAAAWPFSPLSGLWSGQLEPLSLGRRDETGLGKRSGFATANPYMSDGRNRVGERRRACGSTALHHVFATAGGRIAI
jgi:hypothetical protein